MVVVPLFIILKDISLAFKFLFASECKKNIMGKGFTNVLQFDTRVDLSVNTDWMPVMFKINFEIMT
jgi:hypothetical protein